MGILDGAMMGIGSAVADIGSNMQKYNQQKDLERERETAQALREYNLRMLMESRADARSQTENQFKIDAENKKAEREDASPDPDARINNMLTTKGAAKQALATNAGIIAQRDKAVAGVDAEYEDDDTPGTSPENEEYKARMAEAKKTPGMINITSNKDDLAAEKSAMAREKMTMEFAHKKEQLTLAGQVLDAKAAAIDARIAAGKASAQDKKDRADLEMKLKGIESIGHMLQNDKNDNPPTEPVIKAAEAIMRELKITLPAPKSRETVTAESGAKRDEKKKEPGPLKKVWNAIAGDPNKTGKNPTAADQKKSMVGVYDPKTGQIVYK